MSNINDSYPENDKANITPQLWVVTEGMAGTENQCIAVAEALNIRPEVKQIGLRQPWKTLSPYLGLETSWSFTGDSLNAPFPKLVIAAGRKAIAACRYIKQQSPKTFIVFLQNPRARFSDFDLIAAPAHDHLTGENIVTTIATPTKYNPDLLSTIKAVSKSPFSHSTEKNLNVGILLGGGIAGRSMNDMEQNFIIDSIQRLLIQNHYSLFIIGSRRTPQSLSNAIKELQIPSWFVGDEHSNPYGAVLAHSDILIVTSDSPSMMSDAVSSGRSTYIIGEAQTTRHRDLIESLTTQGYARLFSPNLELFTPKLLNDAERIATEIKRKTQI
jgi:mitochondrial fission protein ELM1